LRIHYTNNSPILGGNMSPKNFGVNRSGLKLTSFVLAFCVFALVGCGGSEETTSEQQQPQEPAKEGTAATEQPAATESKPMDDALTSFVGNEQETPSEAPKPAATPSPQLGQYEKQIEGLRTENTSQKQKIAMLEQENRELNARLAEAETKYTAEKSRADKAEELSKNAPAETRTTVEKSSSAGMTTYEESLRNFNARKYDQAANGFKSIIEGSSNDDLVNRAKYWLGESTYGKKKYKEAIPIFEDVLKYRYSEKKADAQFMLAQCYERIGSRAKAKEAYEKVVKDYPMSRNVKRAKARWARL
jgi:tol-pal system protein YbgF